MVAGSKYEVWLGVRRAVQDGATFTEAAREFGISAATAKRYASMEFDQLRHANQRSMTAKFLQIDITTARVPRPRRSPVCTPVPCVMRLDSRGNPVVQKDDACAEKDLPDLETILAAWTS